MRRVVAIGVFAVTSACTSRSSMPAESPSPTPEAAAVAGTARGGPVYYAGEVPIQAAPAKGNVPPRNAGAPDGEARVRFVVGPDGRAEPRTIQLLDGSQPELGRRLIIAVRRWRFLPAQRGDGVPVRQLTEAVVRKVGPRTVVEGVPVARPPG